MVNETEGAVLFGDASVVWTLFEIFSDPDPQVGIGGLPVIGWYCSADRRRRKSIED